MSKAILVINMPEECIGCPCFNEREEWCNLNTREYIPIKVYLNRKPDWCPLKSAPEKYDIEAMRNKPHDIDCDWEFENGYNTCIEDILKEENES